MTHTKMTRREFLRMSSLGLLALRFSPNLISRHLFASPNVVLGKSKGKVLVVIFQRGAMDGLTMLPPLGDSNYYSARPSIALNRTGENAALPLDGHFGLHPSFSSLKNYWDNGTLAFVHQVGSPNATRSHFDAQDYMESGSPGIKNIEDGFLNRAMNFISASSSSNLRAVAMQNSMPRILQGSFPAISMDSTQDFGIQGPFSKENEVTGFETMYKQATDKVFRGVSHEVFDALKTVHEKVSRDGKKDSSYPKSNLAKHLKEIADLVKADVGLQLAVTDMGGWDTHVNQGGGKGQLANRFKDMNDALAAFVQDLGPRFSDVCIVTMTEFGRTMKENGDRGTDHGHGSVMSLLGGSVVGKKVYGHWKELKAENLFEGRDVPVTTDYRDVMAEVLSKHMGLKDFSKVFPNFKVSNANRLGILKS